MTSANQVSVSIAKDRSEGGLSKEQKDFNALIRKIEKRRSRLHAWEEAEPVFQSKYTDEFLPFTQRWTDLQAAMVRRLDEVSYHRGLTKSERRTISELITSLARDLIGEHDTAQLKAIYDRHSPSTYDSETAADLEEMMSVVEAMLGSQPGDDSDGSSPEEMFQRAYAAAE